ncbi:MAG: hypothetical protein O3B47_02730 [bacterium]|nr:hypothetical protein [bacterium]
MIEYKSKKRKKRSKITLNTETKKTIKSLIITLSSMIIVLLIVFIASINDSAQKGYALQQAKQQNESLKTQKATLNTKITDSTAFKRLEENEIVNKMEIKEEKDYITKENNLIK